MFLGSSSTCIHNMHSRTFSNPFNVKDRSAWILDLVCSSHHKRATSNIITSNNTSRCNAPLAALRGIVRTHTSPQCHLDPFPIVSSNPAGRQYSNTAPSFSHNLFLVPFKHKAAYTAKINCAQILSYFSTFLQPLHYFQYRLKSKANNNHHNSSSSNNNNNNNNKSNELKLRIRRRLRVKFKIRVSRDLSVATPTTCKKQSTKVLRMISTHEGELHSNTTINLRGHVEDEPTPQQTYRHKLKLKLKLVRLPRRKTNRNIRLTIKGYRKHRVTKEAQSSATIVSRVSLGSNFRVFLL
mmetsp:Transcript_22375/g.41920  ORF Transcript_22375/g.41920 Transcript_22375/m.41920 type:complete len:296 (-) Transcript_22375:369-1256(-)